MRRALEARKYLHFKQTVRCSRSSAAMIHTVGLVTSLPHGPCFAREFRAPSISSPLSPCALHSNHIKHRMCGWCCAAVVNVAASDWTQMRHLHLRLSQERLFMQLWRIAFASQS